MQVGDIMTRDVEAISPETNLTEAAERMRSLNVGPLPVVEGGRLVGIVTDRDITVRATAEGRDPTSCRVRDVMSRDVITISEDADIDEAAHLMEEHQIRRLPVLGKDGQLCGILSLGDLAVDVEDEEQSGEILASISEPAKPLR